MRRNTRITVCAVLVMMNAALIWGNSFLPGSESSEISGGLLIWLKATFPFLGGLGEFLLRKLAHFSEFTLLGILLCRLFTLTQEWGIHRFSTPLLCGVLAAAADETIQIYVPGRGSSLLDVWIDVSGVCTGILLCILVQWISNKLYWKGKRVK